MKRTMAVLTAILCLVMMFTFSVPFSADETTVTATAPVPITIGAARAEYGATDDEAVTTVPSEMSTISVTQEPTLPAESEAPSNKGVFIGLAAVVVGGLIAGCIIYLKRKKDDGEEDD